VLADGATQGLHAGAERSGRLLRLFAEIGSDALLFRGADFGCDFVMLNGDCHDPSPCYEGLLRGECKMRAVEIVKPRTNTERIWLGMTRHSE
jgi:hypothetical protein